METPPACLRPFPGKVASRLIHRTSLGPTHVLNNMLSIASSSLSFLPPSSLVASSSKAAHIQMKASEFAYGLPGGDNILGEFDPAGFMEGKSKLEVYRLREAELTHGRVSMLASLGFLVQEKFHPLFSGDGGAAIDQIPQLPIWLWATMLAGIGGAEQLRIVKGWAKLDPETSKAASALREGYYPDRRLGARIHCVEKGAT